MQVFPSHEAEQHFDQLIDKALQSPVMIVGDGCPPIVAMPYEEYQNLSAIKYGRLKYEVIAGFDQLDKGEVSTRSNDEISGLT